MTLTPRSSVWSPDFSCHMYMKKIFFMQISHENPLFQPNLSCHIYMKTFFFMLYLHEKFFIIFMRFGHEKGAMYAI